QSRSGFAQRHLPGNSRRQVGHVKGLDRSNPRFARGQPAPIPFEPDTQGGHQTHAGHEDTPHRVLTSERGNNRLRSGVWGAGGRPAFQLCASIKLTASLTVTIFSAASSGISQPNSSSKAITSSTVSRLSAPKSSIKLAFSVTFDSSTPRCSTTIFLTRSATSLIRCSPQWCLPVAATRQVPV